MNCILRKQMIYSILLISLFLAPCLAGNGNWSSLFNGKDLTGWEGVNDVTFEVHDGDLRLVKGMGWLRTETDV